MAENTNIDHCTQAFAHAVRKRIAASKAKKDAYEAYRNAADKFHTADGQYAAALNKLAEAIEADAMLVARQHPGAPHDQ